MFHADDEQTLLSEKHLTCTKNGSCNATDTLYRGSMMYDIYQRLSVSLSLRIKKMFSQSKSRAAAWPWRLVRASSYQRTNTTDALLEMNFFFMSKNNETPRPVHDS